MTKGLISALYDSPELWTCSSSDLSVDETAGKQTFRTCLPLAIFSVFVEVENKDWLILSNYNKCMRLQMKKNPGRIDHNNP